MSCRSTSRAWYADRGIELRTGAEVAELDLGAGEGPYRGRGERLASTAILLATGAEPVVPPIPGADGPGVQTVRRIGDSERPRALGRGAGAWSSAPASSAARPPPRWRCAVSR